MSGCSRASVPNEPDQALLHVSRELAANRPQAAFEALPPSYQADVNALVSEAAVKMDEEVWNGVLGVLRRVANVLETKRDLILQTDALAEHPEKDNIAANWNDGVGLIKALLNSDFANLAKLRKADVGAMLAGGGSEIMRRARAVKTTNPDMDEAREAFEKLAALRVQVVSRDGDTATLKIEAPGEDAAEEEFKRIEGRWVPAEMAEGFKEAIAEARENLGNMDFASEEGRTAKAALMTQVGMVNAMLTQIEAAKTKEEIQGAMSGIMMALMGAMMQQGGGGSGF
jgi:hypothetical protein